MAREDGKIEKLTKKKKETRCCKCIGMRELKLKYVNCVVNCDETSLK